MLPHEVAHPPRQQALRARFRRGVPIIAGARRWLGRWVEQQAGQLDSGDAIDHAMVSLADEPDLLALEVLTDPHLPERAVAPQRHRHPLIGEIVERAGCPVASAT